MNKSQRNKGEPTFNQTTFCPSETENFWFEPLSIKKEDENVE